MNPNPLGFREIRDVMRARVCEMDSVRGRLVLTPTWRRVGQDGNCSGEKGGKGMTLDELLFDIHVLEYELQSFERRFGVLSETFYEVWSQGEEPADSSWVLPWAAWAGAYESWRDYRQEYMQTVQKLNANGKSMTDTIEITARHEPILVSA